MKARKLAQKLSSLVALVVVLACAVMAGIGKAGNEVTQTYMLFNGVTVVDSSDRVSPWISVGGASRVILKSWSANSAAYTGADSQYSDSIAVFRVLFSDSAAFIARDSLGNIVTVRSYTSSSDRNESFPVCGDSVQIVATNAGTNATTVDTTYKHVGVANAPVQEALRPRANGSGTYTLVYPTLIGAGTSIHESGQINPRYMRLRITPVTRNTVSGGASTTPNRTKGINGLKIQAIVIYRNK